MEKQKKLVNESAAKIEKLRKELKIDELPGASAQVQSTTLGDMEIQRKETQLSELRGDMVSRKVRLEKVADLSIEQLESTLPALNLEDATTASTSSSISRPCKTWPRCKNKDTEKNIPKWRRPSRW